MSDHKGSEPTLTPPLTPPSSEELAAEERVAALRYVPVSVAGVRWKLMSIIKRQSHNLIGASSWNERVEALYWIVTMLDGLKKAEELNRLLEIHHFSSALRTAIAMIRAGESGPSVRNGLARWDSTEHGFSIRQDVGVRFGRLIENNFASDDMLAGKIEDLIAAADEVESPRPSETHGPTRPGSRLPALTAFCHIDTTSREVVIGDNQRGEVLRLSEGTATAAAWQALFHYSYSKRSLDVDWAPTIAQATDSILAAAVTTRTESGSRDVSSGSPDRRDGAREWERADADSEDDGDANSDRSFRPAAGGRKPYALRDPKTAAAHLSALIRQSCTTDGSREFFKHWIHDRGGRVRFGPSVETRNE